MKVLRHEVLGKGEMEVGESVIAGDEVSTWESAQHFGRE